MPITIGKQREGGKGETGFLSIPVSAPGRARAAPTGAETAPGEAFRASRTPSRPDPYGNGRLGRLLITLLLCEWQILKEPYLYLSLYFKKHRNQYYELLQRVNEYGEWENWIEFFLMAVEDTAAQAAETAREILDLFRSDRRKIETLGRSTGSALRVHECLQQFPIITITRVAQELDVSQPTAGKAMKHLETLGILCEITGKGRGRAFAYDKYLHILGRETLQRETGSLPP